MRVETNQRLVDRNRKFATYLFFFSFAVLVVGLLVINPTLLGGQVDTSILSLILPIIVLPVAFITTMYSVRMTNLWVRQPRPEEAIRENLKGIGSKSVLFNYYHFPARHVLIAPSGVYAMVTRWQGGGPRGRTAYFVNEGEQWRTNRGLLVRLFSILRFDSLGNPTEDARKAAAYVQSLLADIAPGVQVQPLIVFVDPNVQVDLRNPAVPVAFTSNRQPPSLKDFVRGKQRPNVATMPMTPEQIEAFTRKTLGEQA